MLVVHTSECKPRGAPSNWQCTERLLLCAISSTGQRCHLSAIALVLLTAGVQTVKLRDTTFQFLPLFFSSPFLLQFATGELQLWIADPKAEGKNKTHSGKYQTFCSFVANGTTSGTKQNKKKEFSYPLPKTESPTEGKPYPAIIHRLWESASKRFSCRIRKRKGPSTVSFLAWCRNRVKCAWENLVDMKECMGRDNRKGRKTKWPGDLPNSNISFSLSEPSQCMCSLPHIFHSAYKKDVLLFHYKYFMNHKLNCLRIQPLLGWCHHPNLQEDSHLDAAFCCVIFPRSNLLPKTHKQYIGSSGTPVHQHICYLVLRSWNPTWHQSFLHQLR